MFETSVVIFLVILFFGMSMVDKANDICGIGDFFSGRVFSWNHRAEHINREFNGFVLCLTLAVAGFLISMGISAISQIQTPAPKRVFIQDLEKGSMPGSSTHHKHANPSHHPLSNHSAAASSSSSSHHQHTAGATVSNHHHKQTPVGKQSH